MRRVETELLKLREQLLRLVALILMVVYWQQRRNFTSLKPWASHGRAFCRGAERKNAGIYSSISEARVVATSPPAIQGLGSFSGSFILEDQRQ